MPTNVTPEYRRAEEAFREAQSLDEKIKRLEDMISLWGEPDRVGSLLLFNTRKIKKHHRLSLLMPIN